MASPRPSIKAYGAQSKDADQHEGGSLTDKAHEAQSKDSGQHEGDGSTGKGYRAQNKNANQHDDGGSTDNQCTAQENYSKIGQIAETAETEMLPKSNVEPTQPKQRHTGDYSLRRIMGEANSDLRCRETDKTRKCTEPEEEYSDDEGGLHKEHQSRLPNVCQPRSYAKGIGLFMLLFMALMSVGLLIWAVIPQNMDKGKVSLPPADALETEIERLRQQFPGQHAELWNIAAASMEDVLFDPHPAKPGVLLVASFADGIQTGRCLGQALVRTFAKLLGGNAFDIEIATLDVINNPGQAKFELDQRLKRGFQSGHTSVLIHDLHLLSGEVAILLHMYADNQNAPFKRVAIVSLCEVKQDEPEPGGENHGQSSKRPDPSKWDMIVNDFLTEKWSTFQGESKAQALVGRLAYNVVFVYPSETKPEMC